MNGSHADNLRATLPKEFPTGANHTRAWGGCLDLQDEKAESGCAGNLRGSIVGHRRLRPGWRP